jgi:hypothetical protein
MPAGKLEIYVDKQEVRLKTPAKGGLLYLRSAQFPYCEPGQFRPVGFGAYELPLNEANTQYRITYKALE